MNFPNLTPDNREVRSHNTRTRRLAKCIRDLFQEEYGIDVDVSCRGSTAKRTALPETYFGLDYDMSLQGIPELLEKIAIRSDLFEGCQILRPSFAVTMSKYFDSIECVGHRISGRFENRLFDLSIADPLKDRWKIDYDNSYLVDFNTDELVEVRKAKYLFKKMNVYGSRILGVVGPVVELAIYHWHTLNRILELLRDFPMLRSTGPFAFAPIAFPANFYGLFPERDDRLHTGLVSSFKYTAPNTYNRLLRVARQPTLNPEEYLAQHELQLQHCIIIPTHDVRFVMCMYACLLSVESSIHIEILRDKRGLLLAANEERDLAEVALQIEEIPETGDISHSIIPPNIGKRVGGLLKTDVVFRKLPSSCIDSRKTYIPFEILTRNNAKNLVRLLREGSR